MITQYLWKWQNISFVTKQSIYQVFQDIAHYSKRRKKSIRLSHLILNIALMIIIPSQWCDIAFRSISKVKPLGSGQYLEGCPPGNARCCWHYKGTAAVVECSISEGEEPIFEPAAGC
ncbi:hypothetical protein SK128_013968 [Halocaridina rubra]|uniref:Uncharacterized protein n=1 Tax=Halocaridina rubra TaxID=373956 RepID=A0AAN8XQ07_HALRR